MNLIIFGPQGSGKGTQAEKLAEKFELVHLETGQIFRDIARENFLFSAMIKDLIRMGRVVPDDVTVAILSGYVEKVPRGQGVILDSAPRTLGQIEMVGKMLKDNGRKIEKAIYISLPYDESVARITKRYLCEACAKHLVLGRDIEKATDSCPVCGGLVTQREDDTPEGITRRLDIFYAITMPVIEKYRQEGMLIEIDGNQDVEKVFADILAKL